MSRQISRASFLKKLFVLVLLYGLAITCFTACKEDEDEKLCNQVKNVLTSLYTGDIDTFIQNQDYGNDLDSVHVGLQRLMLQRLLNEADRIGGVQSIDSVSIRHENDSVVYADYVILYGNATEEMHIVKMKRFGDDWKMCVKE